MTRGIRRRSAAWTVAGLTVLVVGALALLELVLSPPSGGRGPFTVHDSAGVRIVESSAPVWGGGPGWQLAESPTLRLGVVEGDPVFQFDGVTGAQRLRNGAIVVADGGSQEVRFYRGSGDVEAVVGGAGEGPGEFTGLAALGTDPGGRIWAWDFVLRRITWLDSIGAIQEVTSLGPEPPMLNPIGVLPDGSFVLKQLWAAAQIAQATETGLRRDRIAYVRFDSRGTLLDTVGLFPGREVYVSEEGGRGVMNTPPFGKNSVGAIWDGSLAIGSQSSFELGQYGTDGALEKLVRIPGRDLSVGDDDLETYIQERLRAVALEDQARFRQSLEAMPVPATKPAYGGFLADEGGNLWVSEWAVYPQVPLRWTVLDEGGRWLGEVEMPEGFLPLAIGGDWILGVEKDELDVEYVALYDLLKG